MAPTLPERERKRLLMNHFLQQSQRIAHVVVIMVEVDLNELKIIGINVSLSGNMNAQASISAVVATI